MEAILEKRKSGKIENTLSNIGTFDAKNVYQFFSNILRILSVILTTSATSASVERTNSALHYAKTDFRNRMSEDRFNALLQLCVHSDINPDYKKIIDIYAMRYPRTMLLTNPLREQ